MAGRPRIAVVAGFWPSSRLDNAGALMVRHRVNALQRFGDVTLFVPAGLEKSPYELGIDRGVAIASLLTPRTTGFVPRAMGLCRRTLTGEMSLGRRVSRAWASQMQSYSGAFEGVEVHWSQHFSMVDMFRRVFPEAILVAYAHDVMSQGLSRRARGERSRIRRAAAAVGARRAVKLEPCFLNRFDRVATFSDKDGNLLRQLGVRVPVSVEQLYFELPSEAMPVESPKVLFAGAMYRRENDQAATWLVQEVWPVVKRDVEGAELLIAGADPSTALRVAASQAVDVAVLGFVPDLGSLYRDVAVVVAPLRLGAGVKMKVIEALARGLPVVATQVGAEGLPDGLFAGVVDDPTLFAAAVINALRDAKHRRVVGRRARRWAVEAHARIDADIRRSVALYSRGA